MVVTTIQDAIAGGFELMRLAHQATPGVPVIVVGLGGGEIDDLRWDCIFGLTDRLAGLDETRKRLASLTLRERQVLDFIVSGLPNKAIAVELNISPRTVENHRAHLMEKLDVKCVAELVRFALRAEDQKARLE